MRHAAGSSTHLTQTSSPGMRRVAMVLCIWLAIPQPFLLAAQESAAGVGVSQEQAEPAGREPAGAETSGASEHLEEADYKINWRTTGPAGSWQALNPAQEFRSDFLPEKIKIVPSAESDRAWEVGIEFLGYGRGKQVAAVQESSPAPTADRRGVEYARGGIVEWYRNDRRGLEQGFTLSNTPEEAIEREARRTVFVPGARRAKGSRDGLSDPAFLVLRWTGDLVPVTSPDGQAVEFAPRTGGPIVLRYSALEVHDATGRELPSWMEGFHDSGYEGVRLVFDDHDAVYPVTVDPLASSASWKAEGEYAVAHFGEALAGGGDVNGDGYDDVVVGAPGFDNDRGMVSLYLGSASGLLATPAWTVEGGEDAEFGRSVAIGNLNGDEYDDIVVGAPYHDTKGAVFVYHGSTTVPQFDIEIPALVGGWKFGHTVAVAPSVNEDSFSDLLVGAPNYTGTQPQQGAVFVFHGHEDGIETSEAADVCWPDGVMDDWDVRPDWCAEGDASNVHFGWSVAGVGHVDSDVYADIVVGAPDYANGLTEEGAAFCFHGSPTGLDDNGLREVGSPSNADWSAEGNQASAHFGWSVAGAGHVNADSYADIVVGAPDFTNGQTDEGRAYVYHGSASGLDLDGNRPVGEPDNADWRGESDQANAHYGWAVASAGDVNGDGRDEIVVGVPDYDSPATEEGCVFLYYGSENGTADVWAWREEGNQFGARFGAAVASAGDVNNDDGLADVLVGAPGYHHGQAEEGKAEVFHGAARFASLSLETHLGLPPGSVESGKWYVTSSACTGDDNRCDALTQTPDAVSYGPIPNSVLMTTGRASDGGLGNTDWLGDNGSDRAVLILALERPIEGRTLCLTTQFITSETTFTTDQATLAYERFFIDGSIPDDLSDPYDLAELASRKENDPVSHCIDMEGLKKIELTLELADGGNGANDSGLLLSRVYFSRLPMPVDVETDAEGYMKNPATHDVISSAGTYSYSKALFTVPGLSTPFSFSISYNSESTSNGSLGRKWSHPYEADVYKYPDDHDDVDAGSYPDTVRVRPGSGSVYFSEVESGNGVYEPRNGGTYGSIVVDLGSNTVTYVTKDNRIYEFTEPVDNSKLLLSKITDPMGHVIEFGYDPEHRLTEVTDTRGENFTLSYLGSEPIVTEVAHGSAKISLEYDTSDGLLRSFTDLSGQTTSFAYSPDGRLLVAQDGDGTLVSNTYEHYQGFGVAQDGDRLTTQRHGGDPDPFDPAAGVAFRYEAELLERIDRLARQDTTAYDVRGRAAWKLNRIGVLQEFTYDSNNHPVEVRRTLPTLPDDDVVTQLVSASTFDDRGNPLEQVSFPGLCVGVDVDGNQELNDECEVDADCGLLPDGRPLTSCGSRDGSGYDVRNRLRSRTDHLGHVSTFDYDPFDNLIVERDALGNEVQHVYSTVGTAGAVLPQPTATTDARDHTSVCTYNSWGYLETATGPLGNTTTHSYNDLGHRTSTTDPLGNKTCFTNDDGGLLLAETVDCGRCVGAADDGASCTDDIDCDSGHCGLTATMTYDARGQVLTSTQPDGSVYSTSYTPTGQLASETDPLGHEVSYTYDVEDRLTGRAEPHPADRPGEEPATRMTTQAYDEADRLTDVRLHDPGHAGCLGEPDPIANTDSCLAAALADYDVIGNLIGVTDPEGSATSWEYDLLGNMLSESDGLGKIEFAYDGRGLILARENARDQQVRYAYDAAGRLTGVETPDVEITHLLDENGNRTWSRLGSTPPVTRSYDALDRLTERTDEFGYTVRYQYDAAGNLVELAYPSDLDGDGQADRVTYTYDRLNRLESVTDWGGRTTTYTYDDVGNLVAASHPDGSYVVYAYDAARRLTGITDDTLAGEPLFAARYTLNAAGLRTAARHTLPLEPELEAGPTESFEHGDANTLADWTHATGSASLGYDADGNLTDITGDLPASLPIPDFTYNALGQLTALDDGHTVFRYDADGLRVEKSSADRTRRFVYDPTARYARLLEEHDANGNVVARYVYGMGLISREGPEGTRVYHYDSRGSTVALTSLAGVVTDRYAYDPYGRPAGRDGVTDNPFTYVGRDGVFDDGNGLNYMRSRYYAPGLMRFIQKDQVFRGSIADPPSLNRYAYASGNPILVVDPNGEFWHVVGGALLGAVINVVASCLDGCDAEEIAGAALEGAISGAISAALPGMGFLATVAVGAAVGAGAAAAGAGLEMALRGDFDSDEFWGSVGTGALGGGVGGGLGKLGKSGGKAAGKGVYKRGLKTGKLKSLTPKGNTAKAGNRVVTRAGYARQGEKVGSFVGEAAGAGAGILIGMGWPDPKKDPPDTTGTVTDDWNPVAVPQPGPQRTTSAGSCASEVWR